MGMLDKRVERIVLEKERKTKETRENYDELPRNP